MRLETVLSPRTKLRAPCRAHNALLSRRKLEMPDTKGFNPTSGFPSLWEMGVFSVVVLGVFSFAIALVGGTTKASLTSDNASCAKIRAATGSGAAPAPLVTPKKHLPMLVAHNVIHDDSRSRPIQKVQSDKNRLFPFLFRIPKSKSYERHAGRCQCCARRKAQGACFSRPTASRRQEAERSSRSSPRSSSGSSSDRAQGTLVGAHNLPLAVS